MISSCLFLDSLSWQLCVLEIWPALEREFCRHMVSRGWWWTQGPAAGDDRWAQVPNPLRDAQRLSGTCSQLPDRLTADTLKRYQGGAQVRNLRLNPSWATVRSIPTAAKNLKQTSGSSFWRSLKKKRNSGTYQRLLSLFSFPFFFMIPTFLSFLMAIDFLFFKIVYLCDWEYNLITIFLNSYGYFFFLSFIKC